MCIRDRLKEEAKARAVLALRMAWETYYIKGQVTIYNKPRTSAYAAVDIAAGECILVPLSPSIHFHSEDERVTTMHTPFDALKFKHPTMGKTITPSIASANQYILLGKAQHILSKERFVAPFFAVKKVTDSAQAIMKMAVREVDVLGKSLKVPVMVNPKKLVAGQELTIYIGKAEAKPKAPAAAPAAQPKDKPSLKRPAPKAAQDRAPKAAR